MKLLLDIGNSRVKWATADPDRLDNHGAERRRDMAAALGRLGDTLQPREVVCSVVAGGEVEKDLAAWCQRAFGLTPRFASVSGEFGGLTNAYPDPAQMGVDRWMALLGAGGLASGAFCVVDSGTAVTVDPVDASGAHLGGWIIPGAALMSQSLAAGTARVRPDGRPGAVVWGRSTQQCVAAGVQAALDGSMLRMMSLLDQEPVEVFVTGGAASAVAPMLNNRCRIVPDLVLQGLLKWSR